MIARITLRIMNLVAVSAILSLGLSCKANSVNEKDLYGTWVSNDPKKSVLILERNRCEFKRVPQSFFDGSSNPESRRGYGKWHLEQPGSSNTNLVVDVQSIDGRKMESGFFITLHVDSSAEEILIYYFIGDPDSSKRVLFKRHR